jgi:methionyl aminopeptidase
MLDTKSEEEVEKIRISSILVSKVLAELGKIVKPGVVVEDLDRFAETYIRDHGAEPAFLGHQGFPSSLCVSVNEAVVHGIPYKNKRILIEGDIVSLDCGVKLNGFYGDGAYTFAVGEIEPELSLLMQITKECLEKGVEKCVVGNRIGDIGAAVQEHAEKNGYGVVRELVGHGVGRAVWEKPEVPNYGKRGSGAKLEDGLVIAIEPMINLGKAGVRWLSDGWTVVTTDGRHSAHYEHTLVVRKGSPEILTTFDFIEEALQLIN